MIFNPTYKTSSGSTPIKTDPVPLTINGKSIPGYQTTFSDGTSKWTSQQVINTTPLATLNNFDYSTLTGYKKSDGTWTWEGTTTSSIPNLSSSSGLTQQQIKDGLYTTPVLQNSLNGIRVQQLGGVEAAKKIDSTIPQANGTSVNPNTPVAETSAKTELNADSVKDGDIREKYPGKGGSSPLVYPLGRNPSQDYIKFNMYRYSPRGVNINEANGDSGSVFGPRAGNRSILGSVSLPIQPNISDTNVVSWGESEMNAIEAAAAMAALNMIQKGVEGAEEAAGAAGEMFNQNKSEIGALIGYKLAEAAVGSNAGLFTRATGGIVNPNLELLFKGPLLRSFTFTFVLSARSKEEADVIKKIIRFFKQGMSVKRASTNLFLKSPNTFGISYIYGGTGKDHPWINRVKECALQTFNVNYTPEGNYATYEDGPMTKYDLTLTFSELDPIYDDDYKALDGNSDTEIGY